MLRVTNRSLIGTHFNKKYRQRWANYRYKELTRWQRESSGLSDWNFRSSGRAAPHRWRNNPESASLTKGTSSFAYKWWGFQQRFLPRVAPENYKRPMPEGRVAWPQDWDESFAAAVTSLTEEELRERLMQELTVVIHEESQRDGYELRRLDFESRPLTELPTRVVIENFPLIEDSLRDRVVRRVVEGTYRIALTSSQLGDVNSVPNLIEFVVQRVRQCREPWAPRIVAPAVVDILAQHKLQPTFGFEFALPVDDRPELLREWEKLFQHDWQFGKAVFTPRTEERSRGNLTWLRCEQELRDRVAFEEAAASDELKKRHLQLIREAES